MAAPDAQSAGLAAERSPEAWLAQFELEHGHPPSEAKKFHLFVTNRNGRMSYRSAREVIGAVSSLAAATATQQLPRSQSSITEVDKAPLHPPATSSLDQSVDEAPLAPLGDGQAIDLAAFKAWRLRNRHMNIVHIKGFGEHNAGVYYLEDALDDLRAFDMIAFDGDDFTQQGFTKLVPMFLGLGPEKRAVAFKRQQDIEDFRKASSTWHMSNGGIGFERMQIVSIDTDSMRSEFADEVRRFCAASEWTAVDFFMLGRAALLATLSQTVVCIGGGRIASAEAMASQDADVAWKIYAQSRGCAEKFPTLLDWAAEQRGGSVTLVIGKDPNEMDGFCHTSREALNSLSEPLAAPM